MASDSYSRDWTPAEDQLLLDLLHDQNVSNDPQARYPDLNWRHITCCMNELSSTRGVVKLRLYYAAEVESRYLDHLQGNMDVARKMKSKRGHTEGASKGVEVVRKEEIGGEGKSVRKVKDSWGGRAVIYLD